MNTITEFSKHFHEKQIGSIEGLSALIRHSAEFELLTPNDDGYIRRTLIQGGAAINEGVNDGNGWNRDTHADGYDFTSGSFNQRINGTQYYGTETSTSPLHGTDYQSMKEEMKKYLDLYKNVCGGHYLHNQGGSVHIHNTIAYNYYNNQLEPLVKLDTRAMYRIIGSFFVRFLPAMKFLAMTNKQGARGAAMGATNFDKLHNDSIFEWANKILRNNRGISNGGHDEDTDSWMYGMERGSYMRLHKTPNWDDGKGILHWENRILDCNASPTLVAAWMSLNRAITLFAFDFARYNYSLDFDQNKVFNNKDCLGQFVNGHERINREYIRQNYKEMMGLLYKYFKKSGCLGAIEIFDKIVYEQSIPEYLNEKNLPYRYHLNLLEKMWEGRNRTGNEELRGKYLRAIKSMLIPVQENLKAFNVALAEHLGINESQAVNLYQMFKREFTAGTTKVDLSFENGRIVDMGD